MIFSKDEITFRFSENLTIATELLKDQAKKFYIRRSVKDLTSLAGTGFNLMPKLVINTCKYGLVKGIAKESNQLTDLHTNAINTLNNCKEALELFINSKQEIDLEPEKERSKIL